MSGNAGRKSIPESGIRMRVKIETGSAGNGAGRGVIIWLKESAVNVNSQNLQMVMEIRIDIIVSIRMQDSQETSVNLFQ